MKKSIHPYFRFRAALLLWAAVLCALPLSGQQRHYVLGKVENALTGTPVMGARVDILTPAGDSVKTIKTGRSMTNGIVYSAYFVELPEGKYHLRFSHDSFEPQTADIEVKYHKREYTLEMPVVRLKPRMSEQQLGEATVTATRVKFYTKRDTLIFNADAFQTAEGSMLDVLIRQLPGVELKDDGRIYVNGRFVESLLLNGDDFFKGDNTLMLENLPTYMVKTVKVYEREPDVALRMMGLNGGRKELVMDVNLKRQYSVGWIANTEWGGGTEGRYLGRLFALRFTPQSRLALVGNLNNVNDRRKPGETGSWTPEQMPSGRLTTKMAALEYNVKEKGGRYILNGQAGITHTDGNNLSATNRENFLTGGNTFERSQNQSLSRNTRFSTSHSFFFQTASRRVPSSKFAVRLSPYFNYRRYTNRGDAVAGTFADDPSAVLSPGLIDSLRGPLAGSVLRAHLLNRSLSQTYGEGHSLGAGGSLGLVWNVPHTEDFLKVDFSGTYADEAAERFTHQQTDYWQAGAPPADFRNQYYNQPGRSYSFSGKAEYTYINNGWTACAAYGYTQQYASDVRELYRLDRLEGWGLGTDSALTSLPSAVGWEQETMDAANSYHANQHTYAHNVQLDAMWQRYEDQKKWEIWFAVPLSYVTKELTYRTGQATRTPRRADFLPGFKTDITYATQEWRYKYQLSYALTPSQPDLRNLVDLTDDSNPLWISYGNPDLKNSWQHDLKFNFNWRESKKERQFRLGAFYSATQHAVARAYTYDRATGVRTSRPENVNGNYSLGGELSFSTPLDKAKRWTLRNDVGTTYLHSVDLTDTGLGQNPRSTVRSLLTTEQLRVDWSLAKVKLGARVKATWDRATSRRPDFADVSAADLTYGLTAQVELPWDLQLSTDVSLYSRYGYDDASLNTDDWVWNARLAKRLLKGNLTLMLDGFDILHQLSNVTRTLNAQGRVETWRNVIPSYVMFHFVYRLNIEPKKRPGE